MTFAKAVAPPLAPNDGLHEAVGSLVEASVYRMTVGESSILDSHKTRYYSCYEFSKLIYAKSDSTHLQGVKRFLK